MKFEDAVLVLMSTNFGTAKKETIIQDCITALNDVYTMAGHSVETSGIKNKDNLACDIRRAIKTCVGNILGEKLI